MMRVKHRHEWQFYGMCGGHWHGTLRRCGCGARMFSGAIGGEDGILARAYARKGQRLRPLAQAREASARWEIDLDDL